MMTTTESIGRKRAQGVAGAFFRRPPAGFTIMELLVVVAIILVLGVIATPVFFTVRTHANQVVALSRLQQFGVAANRFESDHDGLLPKEDASGKDGWYAAADASNADVWYNALPKIIGQRSVGDYAALPHTFYRKENLLCLPGAVYPADDRKLAEPLFAFAMNSRLNRKGEDGVKSGTRVSQIGRPARTVIFFERGIKGEKPANAAAPGYDGRAKGNGRAFVARYHGKGVLVFMDSHAEMAIGSDIMDETGRLHFPQADIVWTVSPDDNPN